MNSYLNYFASAGINILVVILYFKFIGARDGFLGIASIYSAALLISGFVYIFRKKTAQIDAILGLAGIIGMLYALPYKKSWYLLAEIIMTMVVIFSVTYFSSTGKV